MNYRKVGIAFIILAVVLFGIVLLRYGMYRYENHIAEQGAEDILEIIQSEIKDNQNKDTDSDFDSDSNDSDNSNEANSSEDTNQEGNVSEPDDKESTETEESTEDTSVNVPNLSKKYLGILTIPDLNRELPVMKDWDYERLKKAPCRQFGSLENDNLVIVAHYYDSHFGNISSLEEGAKITFTDMAGKLHQYAVVMVDTIDATDVDKVEKSGYDLVLYTCTFSGKKRIAVFCNRI